MRWGPWLLLYAWMRSSPPVEKPDGKRGGFFVGILACMILTILMINWEFALLMLFLVLVAWWRP